MPELKPMPASAAEITQIVGALDDAVVNSIIGTGASATEVLEAFTWLTADDQIGTETERTRTGRVGEVYSILAEELEDYDESGAGPAL
jgi:hypothetical protein